jgi:Concanavalin A-like lectin/glucanases superfamily
MTLTFEAPNSVSQSARRFTATRDVSFIAARYVDRDNPTLSLPRARELVYMDGQAQYPFSVTREDLGGSVKRYTVAREGGWPEDLALHAEEVGLGTPPITLQALNGAYAAWSLAEQNGNERPDRTGHGRSIGGQSFTYGMDISAPVPGNSAFAQNGDNGSRNNGPLVATGVNLADFISVGLTMTCWVQRLGHANNGYDECWASGWFSDNNGVFLPMYWRDGPGELWTYTNGGHAPSGLPLRIGHWEFCAVSIKPTSAGGECIQGVNGAYVSKPSVGLTAIVTNPTTFAIGAASFAANYGRQSMAAYSDVVLWNRPLTQAELEAQRMSTGAAA